MPSRQRGEATARGVSVVIVAYGERDTLERCLASLREQARPPDEIVIVDNGPGPGTGHWLARAYPWIRVVGDGANVGFAEGANRGVEAARHDWVLLLNPDTIVQPGALERLLSTAATHPNALVTPKLLRADGAIDACGLTVHVTGIASCRGHGQPAHRIVGVHDVAAASGAAIMAARPLLRDLGPFDECYFAYSEDLDLSLRARLRGARILCDAAAVMTHEHVVAMTPAKFRALERNRLMTLLKLLRPMTLLRLFPALVLTELATGAYALLRGPSYLWARLAAWRDVLGWRRHWRAARRIEQAQRATGDAHLLHGAVRTLPIGQLFAGHRWAAALERASVPLFRAATLGMRSRA